MNFADNLKKIRKDNNLSQEQLAERLGVSRQAVSKWESGVAYPEMDKMIQIVKMFNLNIDELLNQDIKEVNSNKQSKININKYIDDFLGYVTKTIDMFSSMKFKEKCKCVFEQILIILVLFIGLLILGGILSQVYANIFSFLPSEVYYTVYHFLEGIYLIFWILFIVVLECHIFKVRYLDYYEIVNEKNILNDQDTFIQEKDEVKEEQKIVNEKILLEKKKEKIIIRDPKHSEYKFITGLVNCILLIIKGIMSLIAIGFCMSFMGLVVCLIISFMFIKTGWLFIGLFTGFLGCIIFNFVILVILYNFIISSSVNKRKLAWLLVGAMILMAAGIGFGLIGISRFSYIDSIKNAHTYEVIRETIEMTDDLVIVENYPGITYQVSDNKDIEIIIEKSNTHLVTIDTYWNSQAYYFSLYPLEKNIFKNIREIIQDINNLEIINYDDMTITIKTSKENIEKIAKNNQEYFKSQNEVEQQDIVNDYERLLKEYESQVDYLQDKLCNMDDEYCDY